MSERSPKRGDMELPDDPHHGGYGHVCSEACEVWVDLLEAARALVASCRLPDGTDVPPTITAVADLEAAILKAKS